MRTQHHVMGSREKRESHENACGRAAKFGQCDSEDSNGDELEQETHITSQLRHVNSRVPPNARYQCGQEERIVRMVRILNVLLPGVRVPVQIPGVTVPDSPSVGLSMRNVFNPHNPVCQDNRHCCLQQAIENRYAVGKQPGKVRGERSSLPDPETKQNQQKPALDSKQGPAKQELNAGTQSCTDSRSQRPYKRSRNSLRGKQ